MPTWKPIMTKPRPRALLKLGINASRNAARSITLLRLDRTTPALSLLLSSVTQAEPCSTLGAKCILIETLFPRITIH